MDPAAPPDTGDPSITIGIAGCGGFIGSHLAAHLLQNTSWSILGVDTQDAKIRDLTAHPRFEFIQSDLSEKKTLQDLTERADIVFSLASICSPAQYNLAPVEVIHSNFTHPSMLADACADKGRWLIHFSSSEVYGKTLSSFLDESESPGHRPESWLLSEDTSQLILGPVHAQRWSYAAAKQLLERYITGLGTTHSLAYTIIRPFNFLGPRMDFIPGVDGDGVPRVIACFMDALLNQKPLQLVGGGSSRRCFTYIDDVMECMMRLLQRPELAQGGIFNVGNAENETSIRDLAMMMSDAFRSTAGLPDSWRPELKEVSAESFYGPGYEDSDRRLPDISKAANLLGWTAETGLREAVERTVGWFVSAYRNTGQKLKSTA